MYSVVSHVKRELYKKTQYCIAKNHFRKSETICFTEKDLAEAEWKEVNEFSLHGASYDIIKVSMVNGEKYFFCYVDKKDIIINSLLSFSKKFAFKKKSLKLQIDLPGHNKSILKIPAFFAVFDKREFLFFTNYFLESISPHSYQLEKTHYLSIIIPPPEIALS